MQKYPLTETEQNVFNRIVTIQDMDLMFQYGYIIGQERAIKEMKVIRTT